MEENESRQPQTRNEDDNALQVSVFMPLRHGRIFNDHLFGIACVFVYLLIVIVIGIFRAF